MRMKKLKSIVSLFLVVVMMFSLTAPFAETVSATGTENDLTGWIKGGTTDLTGNAENGWEIQFSGSGGSGNYTSYKADIDASKLQVHFNLSEFKSGNTILLQIVDETNRTESALKGTDKKVNFLLGYNSAGKLNIYGYDSTKPINNSAYLFYSNSGVDFDYSADHVFGFVKSSGGQWVPTLDGVALTSNADEIAYYDKFVNTMLSESSEETYVTFCPWDSSTTIKNINFSSDSFAHWLKGSGTTLTGNEEDGFKISMTGATGSSYASNIDVSKLQVSFNLAEFTTGNFFLHFLKESELGVGTYNGMNNSNTKVNFLFTRVDSTTVKIEGIDRVGSSSLQYLFAKTMTITYDEEHSFGFIKNKDGKWVPALDGLFLTEDATLVTYYDNFVNNMLSTSAKETYVKFSPNGNANTIKNIKFKMNDLSGWEQRGGTTGLTGSPSDGWEIRFSGSGGSGNYTTYKANKDVSDLIVNFNLSSFKSGNSILLQIVDETDRMQSALIGTARKINFLIEFKDTNKLNIYGYDSSKPINNQPLIAYNAGKTFDYTVDHTFSFIKNGSGKWVPALDGVALTSNADEITYYNMFVENMLKDSAGKTYVTFCPWDNDATIKNISFTDNQDAWGRDSSVTVSGDKDSGYNVQGKEYLRAYYGTKLNPANTTLKFKLSVADNQWNSLVIAENMEIQTLPTVGNMEACKGMVFILARNGTSFNLQVWEGTQIFNLKTYQDFDFDKIHTLTFVNEYGNWYVAFDGEVIRSRQMNDMVERVLSAEDGVYYRFTGSYDNFSFTDIKFENTPQDISATSNWNVVGYQMSGAGDELEFSGNGYASWKQKVNLHTNNIELQFKPADGNWGALTICDNAQTKGVITPGLLNPGENHGITFILGRQDDKNLRVSLWDGQAEKLLSVVENFDFDASHKFKLVEIQGNYYFAIDDDIIEQPSNDGTERFITNTITETMKNIGTEAYLNFFNFAGQTIEWKKIAFVEEGFVGTTDWVKHSDVIVSGDKEHGYSVKGNAYLNAYYRTKLETANTTLNFKLSVASEKWNSIAVAENMEMPTLPTTEKMDEYKGMVFIFERRDTSLYLQVWEGTQIFNLKTYTDFDFDKSHALTFVNEYGNWYVAFDGEVIRSRQMNDMVERLLSAENGVHYRFTGCYDDFSFTDIKFENTQQDISATSNWDVVGYKMTGQGNALAFSGNGYAALKETVNLKESNIKLEFKPANNGWAAVTICDEIQVNGTIKPSFVVPDDEHGITLVFGRQKENDLRISMMGKVGDKTAEKLITVIEDFDFDKIHTFRFVKIDGSYYLAVDDDIYENPSHDGDDKYITTAITKMMNTIGVNANFNFFNDQTTGTEWKSIAFAQGEFVGNADWKKNRGVTVKGDKKSGYSVEGTEYLKAYYREKLDPVNTTLNFKLSVEDKKWNSIALAENMDMGTLPTAEQMQEYKGMVFIFERRDTSLYLQVWEGKQIYNLKTYKDFDFNKNHTLSFVNEYGNWYVVFDGEVIHSRQMNDMVEPLLSATKGVYYRFTGCYDNYSFKGIKFVKTPKDTSATSNWNVVGYEMSGSGDALQFNGNGYAAWKDKVNVKENSIELQFKPKNNGWAGFTISEEINVKGTISPRLVVPEEGNALTIILGRQNNTDLRISLFATTKDGKAEKLIFVWKKFDFDAVHEFRFVEKNGSYYLAVDGDIIENPSHDGEEKYITNAISNLIKNTKGNVYFNFFNDQTSGVEWKSIRFVKEKFTSPSILKNGYIDVQDTNKGLSVSGSGIVGINSPFDVRKDKVRVQFKPEDGNWVMLSVGNTASSTVGMFQGLDNEYNMMSFVLGRQNDNQLRISLFDGKQELLMMLIYYFDFNKAHTFSFVQHRGKYYLAIDDRMIEAVMHDGDDEVVTSWITKSVKELSKEEAYIRFCSMDNCNMQLSQINFNGFKQTRSVSLNVENLIYNFKRRKVGIIS